MEKGKFLSNKTKIAETFSDFFKNAVNHLTIIRDGAKFNDQPVLSNNPTDDVPIQKFIYHVRVKLIRHNVNLSDIFKFEVVSIHYIIREVTNLNKAKTGTFYNI